MANRNSRIEIQAITPGSDGRYYGRYPLGTNPAALAGNLLTSNAIAAALSSGGGVPTNGYILLPSGQFNVNGGQRDLRYQPYSSASPFNYPVGTAAQYTPANIRLIPDTPDGIGSGRTTPPNPGLNQGFVYYIGGEPAYNNGFIYGNNGVVIRPNVWAISGINQVTCQMGNHPNIAQVACYDNTAAGIQSCAATGSLLRSIPIDSQFYWPPGGNTGGTSEDSQIYILPTGAALQGQDDTLLASAYFTYCNGQGYATAYNYGGDGFLRDALGGPGTVRGTHGASNASTLGGVLRCRNGFAELTQVSGELQMARHALALALGPYYMGYVAAAQNGGVPVAPNTVQDWWAYTLSGNPSIFSGEYSAYGIGNPTSNPGRVRDGSLLAIRQSVNIGSPPPLGVVATPGSPANSFGLYTVPGWMLAWTLQNYGAYVLDTIGAVPTTVGFYAETGPTAANGGAGNNDQFNFEWSGAAGFPASVFGAFSDCWGFPFSGEWSWTYDYFTRYPSSSFLWQYGNTFGGNRFWLFGDDMNTIFKALAVVTNNGPSAIGGGGIPLQPLAPT